jgi:AraC family transcriptional regulator, arabinose operon regulatory protein
MGNTVSADETPAPPWGRLVADHFSMPFGYGALRRGGTRDWLLTCTLSGEGRYRYSGGELRCCAGHLVLLAPGVAHDYATADRTTPWEFFWAHYNPRPSWSAWLRLPEIGPGISAIRIEQDSVWMRLTQAFRRLVYDQREEGTLHEELALNALEEVLLLATRQAASAERLLDPRIEQALVRLGATLDRSLPIDALAAELVLSPSRLAHLFKAEVGDSIQRVHLRLRLRHAARLLEFTAQPILVIAQETGFPSPFYFSRQFKAHYGVSPSEYRKRLQS